MLSFLHMRPRFILGLAPAFLVSLLACNAGLPPAHASIIIENNSSYARADDRMGSGNNTAGFNGTMIYNPPTPVGVDAISGNAWSKNTFDCSTNGSQTTLLLNMNHQRTGTVGSIAQTYSFLSFTANHNENFELSGFYNVTDLADIQGQVSHTAYLYDDTSQTYLFLDYSESISTLNEQFTLGVTGDGDYNNNSFGSLTGSLRAGHRYQLFFISQIQDIVAEPDNNSTGYADGEFKLVLGSDGVPEASTFAVWSLLGLSVAAIKQRRRRRRL